MSGNVSLLDDLPVGAVTGFDTAPLIYLIEGHAIYGPIVLPLFADRFEKGINPATTSTITLAEVLVKPLLRGLNNVIVRYRAYLTQTSHQGVVPISLNTAEQAADLRARYGLRLPDACQIAAALEAGATHFVTNDKNLRKVTELKVLVLEDYVTSTNP